MTVAGKKSPTGPRAHNLRRLRHPHRPRGRGFFFKALVTPHRHRRREGARSRQHLHGLPLLRSPIVLGPYLAPSMESGAPPPTACPTSSLSGRGRLGPPQHLGRKKDPRSQRRSRRGWCRAACTSTPAPRRLRPHPPNPWRWRRWRRPTGSPVLGTPRKSNARQHLPPPCVRHHPPLPCDRQHLPPPPNTRVICIHHFLICFIAVHFYLCHNSSKISPFSSLSHSRPFRLCRLFRCDFLFLPRFLALSCLIRSASNSALNIQTPDRCLSSCRNPGPHTPTWA